MIDKLAQRVRAPISLTSSIDTKGGHGLPEVAPAGGEHARPYGVTRGQGRQDLLEERVRQGADAVVAASRRCFLDSVALGRLSHSVEEVARAGAAKL